MSRQLELFEAPVVEIKVEEANTNPDRWWGDDDAQTFIILRTGEVLKNNGSWTHGDVFHRRFPDGVWRDEKSASVRGRVKGKRAITYEKPDDDDLERIAKVFPKVEKLQYSSRGWS